MRNIFALGLLATLLAAGCFAPKVSDAQYTCAVSGLCPTGFQCIAGTCVRPSDTIPLDMSANDQSTVPVDQAQPADLLPPPTPSPTLFAGGLGDLTLPSPAGLVTFNTETGEIKAAGTTLIPAGHAGYSKVAQPDGPATAIFSFLSVTIPTGWTVSPTSNSVSPVVIASSGAIFVGGAWEWAGWGALGGNATKPGTGAGPANSGGGGGGGFDINGSGGGGGGAATAGFAGSGSTPGAAGASYGTAMIVPLYFGSGGGGGGGLNNASSIPGTGGAGGGGVAFLSQTSIEVSGAIDVSGLQGNNANATSTGPAGGAGGGSGGSLVLSAPSITLDSGYSLKATGGGPGSGVVGGSPGGAGSDGRIYIQATGVTNNSPNASPMPVVSNSAAIATFPR